MGFLGKFFKFRKEKTLDYNYTSTAYDEDFEYEDFDYDDKKVNTKIDEGDISFYNLPKMNTKIEVEDGDINFDSVKIDNNKYSENEWDLDGLFNTKITIQEAPMAKGRHDRAVYISNGDKTKRTSNIMVGKNDINLPSGEYVSMSEAKMALKAYLQQKEQENAIFKIKGEQLEYKSSSEIEKAVLASIQDKSVIKIGQGSDKITNQETASFSFKDNEKKEYLKKGILFLGKGKLKLPNDEYISMEEIKKALDKYMLYEKNNEIEEYQEDSKIVAFKEEKEEQKEVSKITAFENQKEKIKDTKKSSFKIWPVISTAVKIMQMKYEKMQMRRTEYPNIITGKLIAEQER